MPDIRDVFPSKYLSAADLRSQPRTVVIRTAVPELIGQGAQQQKLVLTVAMADGRAISKQLVLNKTNSMTLATVFGFDYTTWGGKSITLRPEMVLFQGRPQEAIRCYAAGPAQPPTPPPTAPIAPTTPPAPSAPSAPNAAPFGDGLSDMTDDIPW